MKAVCLNIVIIVIILFSANHLGYCQNIDAPPETYEALYSLRYAGYKFDYIVYIHNNSVYIPILICSPI